MCWVYEYPRRVMMLGLSSDVGPMALWLDGHPCSSCEANEPEPRCNPASGDTSIWKHYQIPLAGKHSYVIKDPLWL